MGTVTIVSLRASLTGVRVENRLGLGLRLDCI